MAGEKKDITFNITTQQLKFYNSQLKYDWEPGKFIVEIGSSSADTRSAAVEWLK